ncbi:MAG: hypothetical protein V9E87_12365 [Gemmatimonadales bacterium]
MSLPAVTGWVNAAFNVRVNFSSTDNAALAFVPPAIARDFVQRAELRRRD